MNYLIVGLGNIGSEYADTRHNIGFMVADELVKQAGASFSLLKLAYYSEFKQRGHNVTVIKPTTYMNLSGKAVNYYMQQCKVPIQNVLVIVDDLAIPFGSLRMKPKGSSAGHNGLKSIEQLCGPFDKEEQAELPALIDHSVKMIQSFVNIGIELTMTNLNTK